MKDTNKNIDSLFEKARHLPPMLSINEVKDTITNAPKKPSNSFRKGAYVFIAIIFLSTATYYLLSDKAATEQPVAASDNTPVLQEVKTETAVVTADYVTSKEEIKLSGESQLPVEKKINAGATQQHSNQTAQLTPPIVADSIPVTGKRDTIAIKTIAEDKSDFISDFIVIHRFFGEEELDRVCKKLQSAGIDLRIETKEFNSKNKGVLSLLKADVYIGDQLYKHINLRDFNEIRIGWEKQGNHAVIIKSLAYVDKNYMKRKL